MLNLHDVHNRLDLIGEAYGKNRDSSRFLAEGKVGIDIAKELIRCSKKPKDMKEALEQLKVSIKQLEDNDKELRENLTQYGYEVFAKHLWSAIQAVQQAQHAYVVCGETKHDEQLFASVNFFLRNVPSVWDVAKIIDEMAEKKKKLSGGRLG